MHILSSLHANGSAPCIKYNMYYAFQYLATQLGDLSTPQNLPDFAHGSKVFIKHKPYLFTWSYIITIRLFSVF